MFAYVVNWLKLYNTMTYIYNPETHICEMDSSYYEFGTVHCHIVSLGDDTVKC